MGDFAMHHVSRRHIPSVASQIQGFALPRPIALNNTSVLALARIGKAIES